MPGEPTPKSQPRKPITIRRVVGKLKFMGQQALSRSGLRNPVVPHESGLADFHKRGKWPLDLEQCPCDQHFVDYLRQEAIAGKTVFHFGTGMHHLVGRENAALPQPNFVLGVTAADPEHGTYVDLMVDDGALALSYKVLVADIYTLPAQLLPDFDVVTLFHLCEFYMPSNAERTRHDDESLLRMLIGKTRPGGKILFYTGSFAWAKAAVLVDRLQDEGLLKDRTEFKTLVVTTRA